LYSAGQRNIDELSLYDIQNIIKNFSEITNNNGTINLFGGESLLRDDVFEIISFAKEFGLNVGITTNAYFDWKFIQKLSQSGLCRVTIDLDGGSKETHDWLRNNEGHFEMSVTTIKRLIENGVAVSVTSVLHKNNVHEIEDILFLCKSLKVSSLAFYFFTPLGRGENIKHLMLSGEEWLYSKERVEKWVCENFFEFDIVWEKCYDKKLSNDEYFFCLCDGKHKESIDIRCDGNVYFCGLLSSLDNSPVIGNLKKENLQSIMNKLNEYALENKRGCAALALNTKKNIHYSHGEYLFDPRNNEKDIYPVCPYDWSFLNK
jgi:MoaA/NifB/PqqE/SkfB family radical SAM enzyme